MRGGLDGFVSGIRPQGEQSGFEPERPSIDPVRKGEGGRAIRMILSRRVREAVRRRVRGAVRQRQGTEGVAGARHRENPGVRFVNRERVDASCFRSIGNKTARNSNHTNTQAIFMKEVRPTDRGKAPIKKIVRKGGGSHKKRLGKPDSDRRRWRGRGVLYAGGRGKRGRVEQSSRDSGRSGGSNGGASEGRRERAGREGGGGSGTHRAEVRRVPDREDGGGQGAGAGATGRPSSRVSSWRARMSSTASPVPRWTACTVPSREMRTRVGMEVMP